MAIDLVTKFLPYVDEKFSMASVKGLVTNNDFDWTGAHSVKVYKISTATMNDYGREGPAPGNWSCYGPLQGLDATTETMELKKDRSFTATIDKLDADETANALNGAAALNRQLTEVVVPEVDAYTYGVMAAGAGAHVELAADTKLYPAVLAANQAMDEAEVPQVGRVIICNPAAYYALKAEAAEAMQATDAAAAIRQNGVLSMLDGNAVVKVPSTRLPKDFTFMIAHPCATVAPTKLTDYMVYDSGVPGLSGSLIEGRIVYDAFVLDNKKYAIYLATKKEASGLTVTSVAGSTTGNTALTVNPTAASGDSYKYKTGESVDIPAAGEVCSTGWTDWNGTANIVATTGNEIVVVEVDGNGKAVKAGTATVAAKA